MFAAPFFNAQSCKKVVKKDTFFLRGYTSVNAENLSDFPEFFGRKVLN